MEEGGKESRGGTRHVEIDRKFASIRSPAEPELGRQIRGNKNTKLSTFIEFDYGLLRFSINGFIPFCRIMVYKHHLSWVLHMHLMSQTQTSNSCKSYQDDHIISSVVAITA